MNSALRRSRFQIFVEPPKGSLFCALRICTLEPMSRSAECLDFGFDARGEQTLGNPDGVTLQDGSSWPTFDWIAKPTEPVLGTGE